MLQSAKSSSKTKDKDKLHGVVVLHKGGKGYGNPTTAISDNIMNESLSSSASKGTVSLYVPPHKGHGKEKDRDVIASLAPECLELRSAIGPFAAASSGSGGAPRMAWVGSVVALLHRGTLELVHASHGVRLPFPNPTGLHRGTCLAASATLLAVGSECGGVSMYDPTNMKLMMLIPASVDPLLHGLRASRETPEGGSLLMSSSHHPSSSKSSKAPSSRAAGGLLPHFNAGGKIYARAMARTEVLGAPTSTGVPPSPVVCMKFICHGNALVVLHGDGVLTVTDVSAARDACNHSSDNDGDDNDAASATGTVHPTLSATLTTMVSLDMLMLPPSPSSGSSSGVHWMASSASAAKGLGPPPAPEGKDLLIATCCSRAGQPECATDESSLFAVVRGQTAAVFRVELASIGPAPLVTAPLHADAGDGLVGLEVRGQGLGLGHAGPSAIASAVHAANCPASSTAPTQTPPRVHPALLLSLGTNSLTEVLPLHNPLANPIKPKKTSGGSVKSQGRGKKSRERAAAMMAEKAAVEKQQPVVEEDHPLVKAYQLPVFERGRMDFSEPVFPVTAPHLHGEGAHLVLNEGAAGLELTLYLVCHRDDSEDVARLRESRYPLPLPQQLHLYCGSVVLADDLSSLLLSAGNHGWQQQRLPRSGHRSSTAVMMMPMHPVLNLGSSLSSLSFRGAHCALVVPQGCFLLDLDSAAAAAGELHHYAESTVPAVVAAASSSSATTTMSSKALQSSDNNDDDDESTAATSTAAGGSGGGGGGASGSGLLPLPKPQPPARAPPTPLVHCRALSQSHTSVGNDAATSWSGGAVSITAGRPSSSSGSEAVSVVAFKTQKQTMLRLSFPTTSATTSATLTTGTIAEEQNSGDGHGQGLASVVML